MGAMWDLEEQGCPFARVTQAPISHFDRHLILVDFGFARWEAPDAGGNRHTPVVLFILPSCVMASLGSSHFHLFAPEPILSKRNLSYFVQSRHGLGAVVSPRVCTTLVW